MYRMNLYLKIIIAILAIISVVITNNYYVLLVFCSLNLILLFINRRIFAFVLTLFLLLYLIFGISLNYLIIKIFLIIIIIYIFFIYLSIRQRHYLKNKYYPRNNNNRRGQFYEKNYNYALTNIKNNVDLNYEKEVEIEKKLRKDLERNYLQSRIRFFGFRVVNNNHYESRWEKIDYLILLLSIVLFIIIIIV